MSDETNLPQLLEQVSMWAACNPKTAGAAGVTQLLDHLAAREELALSSSPAQWAELADAITQVVGSFSEHRYWSDWSRDRLLALRERIQAVLPPEA